MTKADFNLMNLDELRRYVLTHREDVNAFYVYVDRSKASGRMIAINPSDPGWENAVEQKIQQATEAESN
ncbi:hypothetical protein [Gloeocapsopsis sp. IPPAS B-1203]|uniref:DUF6887 family protein n=1 Tax=Gloeocapsopsis sp. IPPAS B-1203 TaxID=2049454 RepID=UPI000C19054C|nr:hypothetical protein [Gloeocapsopsis sp. IPPAS B-1203]PIG91737.1 hypothetical protein CSQ79_19535 [Gloeocapsopsis sp. IPPAS B-1203]